MSTTYSELLLFFFGRPAAKSNFIEKTTLKRPMRAKKKYHKCYVGGSFREQ